MTDSTDPFDYDNTTELVDQARRAVDLVGADHAGDYLEWCELTGTEPGDAEDPDWIIAEDALRRGEVPDDRWGLVLLAGAHLAELAVRLYQRGTPSAHKLINARSLQHAPVTAMVAAYVVNELGTPTGYEGEPDRLAREFAGHSPRVFPSIYQAADAMLTTVRREVVDTTLRSLDVTDRPEPETMRLIEVTGQVVQAIWDHPVIKTVLGHALGDREQIDRVLADLNAAYEGHRWNILPLVPGDPGGDVLLYVIRQG